MEELQYVLAWVSPAVFCYYLEKHLENGFPKVSDHDNY